jgi:hypothetical protein
MGSRLRLVVGTLAVVMVAAAAVSAAPERTETRSCAQVWTGFNIQLVGDVDWLESRALAPRLGPLGAPKKKSIVVVWSLGGDAAQHGINVYEWVTATRSRPSPRCTVVKARLGAPALRGLGSVARVKDGWKLGRRFVCLDEGRILITTTRAKSKTRVVVRLQRSGKVLAVGELGNGSGWIRGSKTCESAGE